MTIDTASWGWPQWTLLLLMLLGLALRSAMHGKPMIDSNKEPMKYNAFVQIIRFGTTVFLLAAGGFFK